LSNKSSSAGAPVSLLEQLMRSLPAGPLHSSPTVSLTSSFRITFPESLPVSARRDEISAALEQHQVVIVSGETGSGKTTQLPKIALALGRGKLNAPPGQGRLIGHTQPRRIAASTVAKRIAEELQTPLGDVVGYKIRFQDRLSRDASIKLMTDGILLAETQTDPLLKAYDTLIIDEAHERSLNIDFLLGYLREILPRRPDLKIIVTSATIDADRFAKHFASAKGPAPVITVSGRTFPVEQRWRPFEEARDYGLNNAISDAVDELWSNPRQTGDILVFLPGEREIREAADHLRGHLAHQPLLRHAEVLPLFARLSQAEQERIFDAHTGRRIVLATNVAETSLTVPGIRYVIDTGTARVKRYSFRSKVEQLLVEPISQAAANQRAGRCGRVADGICIRLYAEDDFAGRARFSDPEILRSSLAGVILRMKSLHLGDVAQFPFLEAPTGRAITDGYQLLSELGAVDDANALTPIGRELARLPLDPRIGRMILEARERGALEEVLVIASALSVQDVRDRPLDLQQQADQAHAKFDDEKSEFSGYLKLWQWLADARGGRVVAKTRREMAAQTQPAKPARRANQAVLPVGQRLVAPVVAIPVAAAPEPAHPAAATHKLSNRQYEQLLRQNFINIRRVREWRDIHSQLLSVVQEHHWPLNPQPASYEALHSAMLSGLLGNIGFRPEDASAASGGSSEYLGARGIRFHRHPGAHLSKKPGRWIVCAELVETSRLYGRGIAAIEPGWVEQVGSHLLRRQLLDPHWEKKSAEVVALERATLYGLVIYTGRRVAYSRVDMAAAREIFIREALVAAGGWETSLPFLPANRKLIHQVEELEHKSRRQDVLVDDELIYAFYDQHLPADIASGHGLEQWYRRTVASQAGLLLLTREELMRHEAAGVTGNAFPRTVRLGGVDCAASYLHAPGDAKDGLTVTVPLFVLNQVSDERVEWLVPGMLKEKIQALLKSLPQKPRARLVPLPESAAALYAALSEPAAFGHGSLVDAVQKAVRERTGLEVRRADFKIEMLSPHLFMHIRVVDEHGRQLGAGRNLGAIKAEWGKQARGAFQALAGLQVAKTVAPPQNNESNVPLAHMSKSLPATKEVVLRKGGSPGGSGGQKPAGASSASAPGTGDARYTSWTFGALPELMEIRRGGQTLVGFPALIDDGDAVRIEVFDEPDVAAARHRAGLRRLFALQLRDALKYLEKNVPDLQKMAVGYMQVGRAADGSGGGAIEDLRPQIIDLALDRAFLMEPLPADTAAFAQRLDEGRARLTLIANEVARLAARILVEFAGAARKLRDTRGYADASADVHQQLQRLVPKNFLGSTPWLQLPHLPRYLQAVVLRLDKLRGDPARDALKLTELRPQEQRYWRLVAERKGAVDARMVELRWLLEELRVSFFAQELRTPQPVSLKRLDKAWALLIA
jgi:ATP-dependent helicase HrpA